MRDDDGTVSTVVSSLLLSFLLCLSFQKIEVDDEHRTSIESRDKRDEKRRGLC